MKRRQQPLERRLHSRLTLPIFIGSDLPDRQENRRMRKSVHPFAQKYSASRLPQIKLTVSAVSSHMRGGSRSSRTRGGMRSEEHTSELQSRLQLVCRLLLE